MEGAYKTPHLTPPPSSGEANHPVASGPRPTRLPLYATTVLLLAIVAEPGGAGFDGARGGGTRDLARETDGREVRWQISDLSRAECDRALMRQVFVNLI